MRLSAHTLKRSELRHGNKQEREFYRHALRVERNYKNRRNNKAKAA